MQYEKGEPKKYDQSGSRHKYEVFACAGDEFIKYIEGAFFNGHLQYLVVTSNQRRVEKYGNFGEYEYNQSGERFEFEVKEKEYPGALFGESDETGVRKLGCFIHR